jgi:hypothetical protein
VACDTLVFVELRDRFAAHFAAALVDAFPDAEAIARRAYDLAEAMLSERARRLDAAEMPAIAGEIRHAALLDEPALLEPEPGWDEDQEDPRWLEPPYDPSWDVEARWSEEPRQGALPSPPPGPDSDRARPGLARTQPEAPAAPRERSA